MNNQEYNDKMAQFVAASLTGNKAKSGGWSPGSLTKTIIEDANAAMAAFMSLRKEVPTVLDRLFENEHG